MTNYKEIMNGKREIPISSCPPQVEDLLYGTGSVLHPQTEEDEAVFVRAMEEPLVPEKKGRKPVSNEREMKIKQMRSECGTTTEFSYCLVDTDNRFTFDGERYEIDSAVEDYAPKHTVLGTLYDMDRIVCVRLKNGAVRFYTMKYDPIDSSLIRKFS